VELLSGAGASRAVKESVELPQAARREGVRWSHG
jgi:hypothetical protein